MGSQTLEILRQGVLASLTGGWFYDPHQNVFCNVVHLYLWLYLLCAPFVVYLYFPGTWLTWCMYCILTSVTILLVKLTNMALHRLYDQSMSESNLKNQFFKITKETAVREDETGMEMKVLGNDGSRNSVEQAINEASEENSMMSMENVNSIIDLKVDVHRKNSSESIELLFYAPSMMSANSQQDQQSLVGSTSVTKSIRSNNATANNAAAIATTAIGGVANASQDSSQCTKYLTVYPEHESEMPKASTSSAGSAATGSTATRQQQQQPPHLLLRKSSDDFKRRHQRRRLERQSSLDAASTAIFRKLMRNQSDTIATTASSSGAGFGGMSSFLHAQTQPQATTTTTPTATTNAQQRMPTTTTNTLGTAAGTIRPSSGNTKNSRLQRHRSSETHDERVRQQNRALFLPVHHEHHQQQQKRATPTGTSSSSSALTTLGGSNLNASDLDLTEDFNRVRALQTWILGSSSDVYLADDGYTKSDFGIEQLDSRKSSSASRAAFMLQQQQQLNLHYQHQLQYRPPLHQQQQQQQPQHHHHSGGANIRKDSSSTMSALCLSRTGGMKRRRHSNATSLFKSSTTAAAANAAAAAAIATGQQPTVRRIKSTALEIACSQPSVSNLSPHPNSVEAINGQQQIRNPPSALLPPPSKSLVRNAHLNLCPKFGGSFCSSLNFGASTSGSTTALIEPVYPIVEQADEKASLDASSTKTNEQCSNGDVAVDVEITDITDIDDNVIKLSLTDNPLTNAENLNLNNDDDDDAVDDVPMPRRRKAIDCHDHSAESDVGDILADDDVFKDFDDNLEDVLNDLQHTHNLLDDLQASYAAAKAIEEQQQLTHHQQQQNVEQQQQQQEEQQQIIDDDQDEAHAIMMLRRERLNSSDSETDNNNGSRSPLLSGKNWEMSSGSSNAAKEADKALRYEIMSTQRPSTPNTGKKFQQHAYESRAKIGAPAHNKADIEKGAECGNAADDEDDTTTEQRDAGSSNATNGKSLGAIPKVVKYREINETRSGRDESQLHKRRGGSGGSNGNNSDKMLVAKSSAANCSSSRTSSTSTSSRSISADSFSADIHKMLWLMHGGAVDDRGRPIAGIASDGTPIAANTNAVPPKMTSAHFQFYQEAIQALNTCPTTNSSEGLSLSERAYYRDKIRRSSKQISEPGGSSIGDFSSQHAHDQPSTATQLSATFSNGASGGIGGFRIATAHPAIGVVVSSSLRSRNISNAATLSIQGLLNVSSSGAQQRGSNATAAPILNVDGNLIENYCDYWRPACLLAAEKAVVPKSFYKYRFKCCGYERDFKISMDRLELLALFDRDLHWLHILLAVLLCASVAYLGATILQLGYYKDLFAFLFCAVIAGAQYSLVKSVQPDAASPIHGFNKTVAYSRAIYFCLCGGLLLLFEKMQRDYAAQEHVEDLIFFGVHYSPSQLTTTLLHIMYVLLLCFPLIFSLGLFPQVNTFLMYLLEQLDMHLFGGNAAGSLLGSFLCVLRSILGIMLLYGPLYAALAENKGTQFIVFSIFCAMLIPLGYHLSRSASDFSHIWALIKNCIVSTYRDDDDDDDDNEIDENIDSMSAATVSIQKHATNTKKRAKTKAIKRAPQRGNDQIEMSSMGKLPTTDATVAAAALPPPPPTTASGFNINEPDFKEEDADEAAAAEAEDEQTNLERKSSKSKASSLGSSSQTLAKTLSSSKKAMTTSMSYISVDGDGGAGVESAADVIIIQELDSELQSAPNTSEKAEKYAEIVTEKPQIVGDINEHDDKLSNSSTTNPGDMSTLTAGGAEMHATNHDATAAVAAATTTTTGSTAATAANATNNDNDSDTPDPLPKKLQSTVNTRLKNDLVVTTLLAVIVLGLHCSTVFTVLQPDLNIVLYGFTGALGLLLHYVIPQMRKHMPWLCFARPILKQKEFGQFEVKNAPKIMWFEKVYIYLCMVERNVLFPLLVISALTADAQVIGNKFGIAWGTLIVAICALKFIRNAYSDPTNQYLIVMFTVLLFRFDFAMASETFLIDYFFVSLAFRKCCDFLLKLQFIVTYIAPWQITWGSAFHAFAQPFSVPHSAMLFLQAAISAILSTPLNPFLGSAIFLTSYVRPIKFWERDYNTRRIDHSNTRLSSQLERDLGADDNNLNSIFYEHLTRSLQHSLCGDLLMGRWGNVNQGDCFVLASDYLNCLVHIIELGNGLCTFQMRGLEFRGTYCQQREVEAITEDVEDNNGCCCCDPGHLPRLLSANAMFSTRWLAWQVVAAQYVLEGYSISDNLASATLQVFEYRKVLITYYIKSIIYYVIKNPKLEQWLASGPIQDALMHTLSRQFVDLDPIFNYNLDEDFDFRAVGITRSSFCFVYLNWINFCYDKRMEYPQNPSTAANNSNIAAAPQTPGTATGGASASNDSKSTPNLSTSTTTPQAKSQSQQQLRTRPQKSATMSGSATVNNHCSSEHIATSQSFANISRQTSESAPGLSGAGLSIGIYTSTSPAAHAPMDGNNSSTPLSQQLRLMQNAPQKPLRKEDSPTTPANKVNANVCSNTDKANIKLKVPTIAKDSPIVSLCLALGLLARRSLATASHSSLTGVEFFLHGLHALFKGDFRITSPRDEWVFADMELLHSVVAPAVKMALKLQQDHISNPDEFLDPNALYEAIDTCSRDLVISHEADPVWRSAVLRGAPNLLALRHVMEDGSDEYRIIRLTKRFLSFRVIKLNRECVRGLWAGQQQELIYLRNRNPERGSIQNAKQALRNIINSSCDQPIGYPIYVSPLTTSYADTNEQLCEIIGGAITLESIKLNVLDWWHRIRERCRQGCSSGSMETGSLGVVAIGPGCSAGGESGEIAPVYISAPLCDLTGYFSGLRPRNMPSNFGGSLSAQYGSDGLAAMRSGLAVMPLKPTSTTLLAGLLNREREERERSRKSTQISLRSSDRERRATLPIASTSLGVVSGGLGTAGAIKESASTSGSGSGSMEREDTANGCELQSSSSPRYAKISCSSGSLGIGNIITTPGDYPRKSKGPICLTAAMANENAKSSSYDPAVTSRKPLIELYKKVIIVDDTEIYDYLDLGRLFTVVWPSEEMRAHGGRLSWKDWEPRAGMVGYIVHYWNESDWIPNTVDQQRFRTQTSSDRIVYLIEIGEHFVPVGEYGVREYNQITSSTEELMASGIGGSRSSSVQRELDEFRLQQQQQREGLTPILGSSLESPTSQLASTSAAGEKRTTTTTLCSSGAKSKIKAVSSSSSSEDEVGLMNIEMQRRELLLNMWKLFSDKKKSSREPSPENSAPVFVVGDDDADAEGVVNDNVAAKCDDNVHKQSESDNVAADVNEESVAPKEDVATTLKSVKYIPLNTRENADGNTEETAAKATTTDDNISQTVYVCERTGETIVISIEKVADDAPTNQADISINAANVNDDDDNDNDANGSDVEIAVAKTVDLIEKPKSNDDNVDNDDEDDADASVA